MAFASVPGAAAAASVPSSSSTSPSAQLCPGRHGRLSFPLALKPSVLSSSKVGRASCNAESFVRRAQLNEVMGGSSNDAVAVASKPVEGSDLEKEQFLPTMEMSPEAITEFMTQVASLVKLVDSKDVIELQLKQPGCELVIRKKEALSQPPAPQVVMMPSHAPPAATPPAYSAPPPAAAPAASAVAAPSSSPPPAKHQPTKSSHPPLKSPMAGTFYRSPAPGQPPFVKPGDKVKKGQVLCIIEAMKLMNEIEADHEGTVVEILAEDGKPVGVEQPLFVIEP